jgi:hypothetical protein
MMRKEGRFSIITAEWPAYISCENDDWPLVAPSLLGIDLNGWLTLALTGAETVMSGKTKATLPPTQRTSFGVGTVCWIRGPVAMTPCRTETVDDSGGGLD